MTEVGVVIGTNGEAIYWHLPPGRTGGSIPDDRNLWDVLWTAHKNGTLAGFAHSHPGGGVPGPSYEDVTTFSAIELAFGQRYPWWIASSDHLVVLNWVGEDKYAYKRNVVSVEPIWLVELRQASNYNEE